MLDLEKSIADWRQQMLAAGIQTPVPLEELESHLREEIERQMKSGANAQTAFLIAVEDVGRGHLLKAEFKKVGGMDKERQRKCAGIIYAMTLGFYLLATIYAFAKNGLSISQWRLGLASLVTLLLLVYSIWRFAPRIFPLWASQRVRSSVGLMGGISGMVWLIAFVYLILPGFDFTTSQLLVAISWAMVPTFFLPSTAFLMLDRSESQPSKSTGL